MLLLLGIINSFAFVIGRRTASVNWERYGRKNPTAPGETTGVGYADYWFVRRHRIFLHLLPMDIDYAVIHPQKFLCVIIRKRRRDCYHHPSDGSY